VAVTGERGRREPAIVIRPRFAVEAVAWAVGALVALVVLDRSRHVLALVLVAVALAVLLHAPITALDRRLPRWAAITTVVVGSIVAVGAVMALGTIQLSEQIDNVNVAITDRIEAVDPDSSLGEFLTDARVAERVGDRLDQLPSQILIGSPAAGDGARLGLEALLVIVLAVYALLNGARLLRPLTRDAAPWWVTGLGDGVAAGASQVRRLLGIAVVSGIVGWIVALLFGLPGAGILGIWVGVWSVVPIFGPIVGYTPMVVVASLDGTGRAIAVGVVSVALAVAGWYLDRTALTLHTPRPVHRLGPFGLTVALVIGLRFGWLTGPLVAILVAASVVSTLASLTDRRPPPHPDDQTPAGGTVWSRLVPRSTARAAVVVVLAVAAIAFVIDLAPVPVWLVIGVTLAVALDPLVNWIDERTPFARGASIAAVIVGLLAAVAVTLVFAVPSVANSVRELDDELPAIAADLEQLPLIGGALAERGVAERLQSSVEELPDRIAADTSPIEGTLRSVGDGLLATFWILLITVSALVDGARARAGLRSLFPPHRRPEFERVDSITRKVVARYAVGSVVIAAIAGSAVFVIALVAGIPLAPLLGLWAFMANFIPQIGGYLGGAPLVVMALTLGATKGLIVAAVYLVYMQIENRIIQPVIVSKAVAIAPFVAMVTVLIGGAAAGVVGAVLATPLVAVAKSLHTEFRSGRSDDADGHATAAADADAEPATE
jgi:predicted PurR-regulated permease PerM